MRNKDIIKQYVNTGKILPEYQFSKLNSSLLKSYFRTRKKCLYDDSEVMFDVEGNAEPPGINSAPLRSYEFIRLSDDDKNFYIKRIIESAACDNTDARNRYFGGMPHSMIVLLKSKHDKIIISYLFNNKDFKRIINTNMMMCIFCDTLYPIWFKNMLGIRFDKFYEKVKNNRNIILGLLCDAENKTEIIEIFNIRIDDCCNREDFKYMLIKANNKNILVNLFGRKLKDCIETLSVDDVDEILCDTYHDPAVRKILNMYAQ